MKETDDTDRYHRVLDYFTNDDGSGEFNTGSGKFYLESVSFKVCLQSRGTSSKDQNIYFWHIFEIFRDFPSRKLPKTFLMLSQPFSKFVVWQLFSPRKKFSLFKNAKSGKQRGNFNLSIRGISNCFHRTNLVACTGLLVISSANFPLLSQVRLGCLNLV